MCGPYQLLQKCKGAPMSSNWGCGQAPPQPGWTKNPSAYQIPQQDTEGKELFSSVVDDALSSIEGGGEEFDGMAPDEDPKGHCGTFMVDGANAESWFYFLKIGK
eukprot:gnl/MRDRNA2_/MRDRNA2_62889_c0_seq2.p1 gnl/MRDRNA2_/MRDRNA2_62889_c0~~gnl/MRDRNA2_/MRDRNA2_62889_c0_seq2.p1  ORF type:complete len:104 (-),score=26.22 gnl/MRDRNA2_/MRDRNA2_62889_c0_seq2:110-421(-)